MLHKRVSLVSLTLAMLAALLCTACLGGGALPTPSPSVIPATPTPATVGPVIEPENAPRLKAVGQIAVSAPAKLIWSLSGNTLAVISQTQGSMNVSLYDTTTLQAAQGVAVTYPMRILDFSPDGHTLALAEDLSQVHSTT